MPSDAPLLPHSSPDRGLPPVAPPSGRFLVQLFIVPGVIVLAVVLVVLAGSWLWKSTSSPERLLEDLDSTNANVRWPAAEKLAQTLKRDDDLASDPKMALRLAGLLQRRLAEYDRGLAELSREAPKLQPEEINKRREALKDKRRDIQFLSPCLGSLMIPVGAPLLCEIASRGEDMDEKSLALLRRQAVWALGNLGENLKRFPKLPPERRQLVIDQLQAELGTASTETRPWIEGSLRYLRTEQQGGQPDSLGVIATLSRCAEMDDAFLRELVAQAFNFWQGDARESAEAEKTLYRLATDKGQAKRIEVGEND